MAKIHLLGDELRRHWQRFRACFRTHTRDTSEHALEYMQGQLTMEGDRTFAGIADQITGEDGQALQHFMSQSPWSARAVYAQVQAEIKAEPLLQHDSMLVLDESADEKAGVDSAGVSRQYNGRMGKVDQCVTAVLLGYVNWKSSPWPTWTLADSELFLAEEWFSAPFAERRKKVGIPPERKFATKLDLGLQMIRRAKANGLPFAGIACDDLYGRSQAFRAALAQEHILYAADVPANTRVYLERPEIGLLPVPAKRKGRPPTRSQVVNGVPSYRVAQIGKQPTTYWQKLRIRHHERGVLEDDFAARLVWTWDESQPEPRQEWLVMRIDRHDQRHYTLSNAPHDVPVHFLAELACTRFFVERLIQDAKEEAGWGEFQAQKYLAWEHHTALTACALCFIMHVKLSWAQECERDPELVQQLEVQVLPALSTANVREMLRSVLPLPQLSPEEAQRQVIKHLVHRSRSTASRLRHRHRQAVPP